MSTENGHVCDNCHWTTLRGFMERYLDPMAGQEGTADLWEAVEAVDQQLANPTEQQQIIIKLQNQVAELEGRIEEAYYDACERDAKRDM
jgi:hypothetical protein